jgi:hypothetical protein
VLGGQAKGDRPHRLSSVQVRATSRLSGQRISISSPGRVCQPAEASAANRGCTAEPSANLGWARSQRANRDRSPQVCPFDHRHTLFFPFMRVLRFIWPGVLAFDRIGSRIPQLVKIWVIELCSVCSTTSADCCSRKPSAFSTTVGHCNPSGWRRTSPAQSISSRSAATFRAGAPQRRAKAVGALYRSHSVRS